MENFTISEKTRIELSNASAAASRRVEVNDVMVRINKLSEQADNKENDIAVRMTLKHQITKLSASIPALLDKDSTSAAQAIDGADEMLSRSFANIQANMADAMAANTTSLRNEDVFALLA